MATEGDKNPRHDATMPLTPPGARPATAGDTDPLLGKKVDDRYELKIVLGEGGMGKVYLAEDTKLGRRVALKLMGASLTMDPEFRSRFEREAVLQANLPHPQVIQIIDMGETPEGAFIVMEYSDGRSLSRLLRELGPLALERALETCEQILEVLDFAHGQNVVHRDLKPANILVEERPGREIVRLLDFGIAKLISAEGGQEFAHTLTKQGFAYGTLGYMAPEQARGDIDKVDHRVDIYAVGIMLHEMLTGEVPAPPESRTHPVRYAMWVAENKITPLSESHPDLQIAEQVDEIMQKALHRNPDKRYQSAFAFRNAIKEFRQSASARTVARPVDLPKTDPIESPTSVSSSSSRGERRGGGVLGWAMAGVFAVVAGFMGYLYMGALDGAGSGADSGEDARKLTAVATAINDMGFEGDLDASLASLKSRLSELEAAAGTADPAERTKLEARIAQLKKDVQAAESERDQARGELEARDTALQGRQKELATTRGELQRVQGELAATRKQVAELMADGSPAGALTAARERIAELEGEITGLKGSVQTLEGEKARLEKEKGALQARLSASGDSGMRISELEGKVSKLERERDLLAREKANVERERKSLAARNAQLEADNTANRKELGVVRGELDRARRDRTALDARVQSLEADNARLRTQSAGNPADAAELSRLRNQEATLKRQVADANRRIGELQAENRRLQASGGGRPVRPVGRPFTLTLHNRFSHELRVNEVIAVGPSGSQKVAVPEKDRDITAARKLNLAVPAGTTRVVIRYYRFDWRNRRWVTRTVEENANVSPNRATVEIK